MSFKPNINTVSWTEKSQEMYNQPSIPKILIRVKMYCNVRTSIIFYCVTSKAIAVLFESIQTLILNTFG